MEKVVSIQINSKQLVAELIRQKEAGQRPNFRVAALSLMPEGVKWFESGEDWGFAIWLERMANVVKIRGRHVVGTYHFNDRGSKF